jgi:hypothetical protein
MVRPFLFHETKRGEPFGICLFLKSGRTIRNLFVFKVGANHSENFWNLTLEAFLSDSILLKNEARWVKKASSAPNGGSLKDLHEKESKG